MGGARNDTFKEFSNADRDSGSSYNSIPAQKAPIQTQKTIQQVKNDNEIEYDNNRQ